MKKKTNTPSKFKVAAEEIVPNKFSRKSYLYSILVVLMMLGLIGGFWRVLPSEIPLFFSRPWGETRLAQKTMLFLLPGLNLGVVNLNLVVQKTLKIKKKFVGQFAAGSSLAISVLFLWAFVYIVLAVL